MSVSRVLRDDRDGPLPPLLLLLTVVTGLVDAASYLRLGHVFVANMTGNVVFLGFAIAGAKGLSIRASAFALGAFLVGGLGGGPRGCSFRQPPRPVAASGARGADRRRRRSRVRSSRGGPAR